MNERWRLPLRALAASAATCAALLVGVESLPQGAQQAWRERVFDVLLAAAPFRAPSAPLLAAPIIIVDIDRASVAKLGPWPWRREVLARLVAAIAQSKPRAIGVDILFEGPDTRSPAALARRLAAETHRDDLAEWSRTLPDDDASFARSLGLAPVALGYAMDPDGRDPAPDALFRIDGAVSAGAMWRAPGALLPAPALADAAAGFGAASLPGDADGVVRRAPALVVVAGAIRPGLALETLRLALAEPVYGLKSAPDGLVIELGGREMRLPEDGMTRLPPDAAARADIGMRSAAAVLAGEGPELPAGAIVWVGASIPEAGALRASAGDPLVASTRLQAAALAELRDGRPAYFARALDRATPALTAALATAALVAGLMLQPGGSMAFLAAALAMAWAAGLFAATRSVLWDPTLPSLMTAGAGLPPALMAAAATYRRERLIRRRFEQHLAPAIVRRIAANPAALRLAGERREVTALFTDLEGFTPMSKRLEPVTLVRLLDGYFEGIVRIVLARGGMIDKFVGDAVHAFFNMPVDQAGHAEQAILCAREIGDWSEAYRAHEGVALHRMGRTRIGVECGIVIAGEVGAGAKLDYTAYGEAVNLAARLEGANKRLGTQICIGPTAAGRAAPGLLRPTGRLPIAGFDDEVDTFGFWPKSADAGWRAAFLVAWAARERGDPAAGAAFLRLDGALGGDPVAHRLGQPPGA